MLFQVITIAKDTHKAKFSIPLYVPVCILSLLLCNGLLQSNLRGVKLMAALRFQLREMEQLKSVAVRIRLCLVFITPAFNNKGKV